MDIIPEPSDFFDEQLNNLILRRKRTQMRSGKPVQNFEALKEEYLTKGELFEDPQFPADESSLKNLKSDIDISSIRWKRPRDINPDAQFCSEELSQFGSKQGDLGNCYLLGVIGNLSMNEHLRSQVVPKDQSFDEDYAGIFHFRFWYYGLWVDIVIDDRLPTVNDKMIFLDTSESNEFWGALLEKAYAKLLGSYGALDLGGEASLAMEDFTGGIAEIYNIEGKNIHPNLFNILLRAFERSSMLCCSIETDEDILKEQGGKFLEDEHVYTITLVKYVDAPTSNSEEEIQFLRLRNPWGATPDLEKWYFVPDDKQNQEDLPFGNDAEFWMSFANFKKHFTQVDIWDMNLKSLDKDNSSADEKKWEINTFEGKWVRGVTAGGCPNHLEEFWHNPQYFITLEIANEDDETCSLIIALMQKNRRENNKINLPIGFVIFPVDDPDCCPKPLDIEFSKKYVSFDRISTFMETREITHRYELPPGTYCVVPSTLEPNQEEEFLLRIASEKKNNMREHDEFVKIREVDVELHDEFEIDLDENELPEPLNADWIELKEFLDSAMQQEMYDERLSEDVCKSMVTMLDTNQLEKLSFRQCTKMWNDIKKWRAAFREHHREDTGVLKVFTLREALYSAGFKLNNHILNILGDKFCTEEGEITFDDFIMCAVQLKTMIDHFQKHCSGSDDSEIFMMMEEWMEDKLFP